MTRLGVSKTHKLFINGAFVRSESARSYSVTDAKGKFLAQASQASRKDARDAVRAARGAFDSWAGITAYNRGQILYRIAETMEGRREQFIDEACRQEGLTKQVAAQRVDQAIDLWVWYAGWTDKYLQIAGGMNPVAGPYFNLSVPEPSGVAAIIAPQDSGLLGLVAAVAPALVSGNTVVAIASEQFPLSAVSLAESIATSDVPKGVVNLLTGAAAEMAPWLASHADVNTLDLRGAGGLDWVELEIAAADTLKRVLSPAVAATTSSLPPHPLVPERSLAAILAFTEVKTVWHTKSML